MKSVARRAPRTLRNRIAEDQTMPQLLSVFCCYNRDDKTEVESIANRLKERGKIPWLCRYEVPPGVRWKTFVKDDLANIRSLAIFIGPHGISEGQAFEIT